MKRRSVEVRKGLLRRALAWSVAGALACGSAGGATAQQNGMHTDPLNLLPQVRQGYERFYNLDYDGALKIFKEVAQAHPKDPMAWNYVLVATLFRELYRQDLLDTTYYAHDNFLSNKREIDITPAAREEIEGLVDKVISLADDRLKENGNDKDALFARGFARGMHAVYLTLVDHAFAAAAKQGYESRNDSEAVLKLDPQYADAEMAVGIQEFAVASLPRVLRLMVGFMGLGGSKQKGLAALRDAAAHGVVTGVESRTILSLFLRHDARYPEALEVERGLSAQFPHNYLFRLEVANLLKDEGHGVEAVAAYKQVLADAGKPGYFVEPRLQLAWFGLADTERGYNQIAEAAQGYTEAVNQPGCSDWLRRRAALDAGEMDDLLHQRAEAVHMYEVAAAAGGDQSQAEAAKRFLKTPYTGK